MSNENYKLNLIEVHNAVSNKKHSKSLRSYVLSVSVYSCLLIGIPAIFYLLFRIPVIPIQNPYSFDEECIYDTANILETTDEVLERMNSVYLSYGIQCYLVTCPYTEDYEHYTEFWHSTVEHSDYAISIFYITDVPYSKDNLIVIQAGDEVSAKTTKFMRNGFKHLVDSMSSTESWYDKMFTKAFNQWAYSMSVVNAVILLTLYEVFVIVVVVPKLSELL